MRFQVSGLESAPFLHLFGQDSEALAAIGVRREVVDEQPGFPCRISLREAAVGENVLLLNYEHQPASSPYRSRHAIFIREWAEEAALPVNTVPESLRIRQLSVRSFDEGGEMLDAALTHGEQLETVIENLFENHAVAYLHVHNAIRGCYAARVDRA